MEPARIRALIPLLALCAWAGALWRGAGTLAAAPEPCPHPCRRGGVVVVCHGGEVPCDGDLGGRAWLFGRKLDLNTASAADLERIRGVGPALARRIVTERQRRGRFDQLEELDRVPGIGPKLLQRIAAAAEVRSRRDPVH